MSCRVSGNFTHTIPVFTEDISRTICEEDVYEFGDRQLTEPGIYVDTFRTAENCKNVVTLNLKVLGELADTVKAKIFEGERYSIDKFSFNQAGNHLITIPSAIGCDSLVLLELDFFKVYFPNVFSPNFDGLNDIFKVEGEQGLIQAIELSIFDRWGNLVFEGAEWDGSTKGNILDAGVFIYVAELIMSDGIERQFSGEVTLIK